MSSHDNKPDAVSAAMTEATATNSVRYVEHRWTSPDGAWVVRDNKGPFWKGGMCVTPEGEVEHA